MRIYIIYNILWVTTQTQLVLTPPPKLFSCQGSDLSSLGNRNSRKINLNYLKKTRFDGE